MVANQHDGESLLSPYRVLDLTEGGCMVGGKILGDLGADVIKVEPPGGSLSRNIGPFYKDIPDPEKSLFWFAYNTNKRSITLDITKRDGQEVFMMLVKDADFVLESFEPGYMDSLGLGYPSLEAINPRIILASVTPYGQAGPKAHYKSSELTAWASGALHYTTGDPDRSPTWIGFPQAYLHGGAEAATASMIAHWHRELTGEGQWVDVSIQQCVIWCLMNATGMWAMNKFDYPRAGSYTTYPWGVQTLLWPCKDGYLFTGISGGGSQLTRESTTSQVELLAEAGMAPDWLKGFDWFHDYDLAKATQELVNRVEEPFAKFYLAKTKAELYEDAVNRRIMLAPVNNAKDICENVQLQARDFWVKVEHPELDDTLTYCGPFIKISETPWRIRRRPPLIGEHNDEVYEKELGFSKERMILLKQAGVV